MGVDLPDTPRDGGADNDNGGLNCNCVCDGDNDCNDTNGGNGGCSVDGNGACEYEYDDSDACCAGAPFRRGGGGGTPDAFSHSATELGALIHAADSSTSTGSKLRATESFTTVPFCTAIILANASTEAPPSSRRNGQAGAVAFPDGKNDEFPLGGASFEDADKSPALLLS